jgi:glycosyltransferase 2 family protein
MGNNVLPARSGDLLRAFLLAAVTGSRKRKLLGTVVAERLLDAAALALVFVALAYGLFRGVGTPDERPLLLVAGAAALVAGGAFVALVALRRSRWARRVRDFARALAAPTRELASGHGAALLAISLVLWTLEAAVYLAVGGAANVELSPLEALYVVALTNLFALVPAAPGYVGTFDAAVLFALGSLGTAAADALSYLVLLRFVLFVPITLVGLAFLFFTYGGWSRLRAARLEATGAG